MHDLFPHSTVPFSLTFWIAAAFCGPALGPVLAGYVVPEKGWHLGMWEIAYMAGPTCVLLLLIPETYEPAIQAKHVAAVERTRPHLEAIIQEFDMERYFGSTPLVSSEAEDEFMRGLPAFGEAAQGAGLSSML